MTERETFKKFDKLSENELDKLCNKSVFVTNTIMTNIINHCRGEKRGIRAIDGFRRQLMPDHQIFESIEHKVKSKIGTIFVNEDILEEYSVKIYKIDPYFSEHYKKKYQLIKMVNNIFRLELILIFLNTV